MVAADSISLAEWERLLIEDDFLRFLKHVKILDRAGRGTIPFELWDHSVEMAHLLVTERLLSIGKSRQVGASWELAAFAVWTAEYHEGALVMLFSQGEDEAQSFLSKCKFIHENLPVYLRVVIGTNSASRMTFPSLRSMITAYPSTQNAGRGETATVVIQDEFAFHTYAAENLLAVKPTIDAGGQLIQVSTIKKADLNGPFAATFRNAKFVDEDGDGNGFTRAFYGWRVREERDDEWYAKTAIEAPETDEISAALYMEQEYPETWQEMLRPSKTLSAFDVEALNAMMGDVKEPVEVRGLAHIFQLPRVGGRYCAGADVSHGVGLDESVLYVLDARTGYMVADIHSSVTAVEDFASECNSLLKRYGLPILGVEDNEWGKATIKMLERLPYPRLYEYKDDVAGWHTDSRTRPIMWTDLMEAVKDRLITIPCRHVLGQFYNVIRNPKKDGRPEAQAGTHDDAPMAAAIAWQMRNHIPAMGPRRKSRRWVTA